MYLLKNIFLTSACFYPKNAPFSGINGHGGHGVEALLKVTFLDVFPVLKDSKTVNGSCLSVFVMNTLPR